MQTNLNKTSTFFERISQITDYYNISSINIFAIEHLNYTSSEKINRLKKENAKPSVEILIDITNKFEDVNPEWLLTGNGEMLKSKIYANHAKGVPLYDVSVSAGGGTFEEMISENKVVGNYIIPNFSNIDWMMYVNGSSMYPKYSSGDIIACREIKESKFIQWGKVYAIATKFQGLLIKRIEEAEDPEFLLAVSDNPKYKPFNLPKDEICGIAIVVGVIRLE